MLKTTHSGDQSQIELPGSNFRIVSNAQNDDGHFIRNQYCGTGLLVTKEAPQSGL